MCGGGCMLNNAFRVLPTYTEDLNNDTDQNQPKGL